MGMKTVTWINNTTDENILSTVGLSAQTTLYFLQVPVSFIGASASGRSDNAVFALGFCHLDDAVNYLFQVSGFVFHL